MQDTVQISNDLGVACPARMSRSGKLDGNTPPALGERVSQKRATIKDLAELATTPNSMYPFAQNRN